MNGYDYLKTFLRNENFRYDETDSLITFKYQGNGFIVFKNDTPYLQIIQPIDVKRHDRYTILEICNSTNNAKYVTKCTVDKDTEMVCCSYEFLPSEHMKSEDFIVILNVLDASSDDFINRLNS